MTLLSSFYSLQKIADVTLTGKVTTQGKNESITFNRAKGDARKNSTDQLTLTMTYTGLELLIPRLIMTHSNPQSSELTLRTTRLPPVQSWSWW